MPRKLCILLFYAYSARYCWFYITDTNIHKWNKCFYCMKGQCRLLVLKNSLISWRSMRHLCVSWLSHVSAGTNFLTNATDYFSHMHQRQGTKTRRKVSLPQPCIETASYRSRVRYTSYWNTWSGLHYITALKRSWFLCSRCNIDVKLYLVSVL